MCKNNGFPLSKLNISNDINNPDSDLMKCLQSPSGEMLARAINDNGAMFHFPIPVLHGGKRLKKTKKQRINKKRTRKHK